MKDKDDIAKLHKAMEDKREREQVKQFRKRGMHDLADQVEERITKREKANK